MARVTEAEVKEIIDVDEDLTSILAHIMSANILVTKVLGTAGLEEDHLKEIERWLSAHFVAIQDQREKRVDTGEGKVEYWGKVGLGLDFTSYGQQVKVLDTTGKMADLGKKQGSMFTIDFAQS